VLLAALSRGVLPTSLLPHVLAFAPTERNQQVTVGFILGEKGCALSSEERFQQLKPRRIISRAGLAMLSTLLLLPGPSLLGSWASIR
jgi:hypothetical protein